jgi:hypothetical protein
VSFNLEIGGTLVNKLNSKPRIIIISDDILHELPQESIKQFNVIGIYGEQTGGGRGGPQTTA